MEHHHQWTLVTRMTLGVSSLTLAKQKCFIYYWGIHPLPLDRLTIWRRIRIALRSTAMMTNGSPSLQERFTFLIHSQLSPATLLSLHKMNTPASRIPIENCYFENTIYIIPHSTRIPYSNYCYCLVSFVLQACLLV
jgi:hypothetical protein